MIGKYSPSILPGSQSTQCHRGEYGLIRISVVVMSSWRLTGDSQEQRSTNSATKKTLASTGVFIVPQALLTRNKMGLPLGDSEIEQDSRMGKPHWSGSIAVPVSGSWAFRRLNPRIPQPVTGGGVLTGVVSPLGGRTKQIFGAQL